MSRNPGNVELAPIRITGLPEELCFTTVAEFIAFLKSNSFAEISTETITNVHVGNVQPNSTQRTDAWFFLSNSGKFVGIFMFDGSTWKQVLPAPKEVFWMYGDSTVLPEGFILVDSTNPNFSAPSVTHIQSYFFPVPPQAVYTYFAVTFAGF